MDVETIELFKKTHLPKKGWIQGCFNCKNPTSKLKHITTISNNNTNYDFYCHICKHCKDTFKKDDILHYNFIKDCKIYIYDKYYYEIYY